MRFIALICLATLIGCAKPEPTAAEPTNPATPPGATSSGGAGGIAPLTGGAGGMTPVVGSESLDATTGGGVAQAAKDRARAIANAPPNTPPAATAGDEDGGE